MLTEFMQKEFLNNDRLIGQQVKTRTLNSLREELKRISDKAENKLDKARLIALSKLIDDAYSIDMYGFAFKIFSLSIQRELVSIEKTIKNAK